MALRVLTLLIDCDESVEDPGEIAEDLAELLDVYVETVLDGFPIRAIDPVGFRVQDLTPVRPRAVCGLN